MPVGEGVALVGLMDALVGSLSLGLRLIAALACIERSGPRTYQRRLSGTRRKGMASGSGFAPCLERRRFVCNEHHHFSDHLAIEPSAVSIAGPYRGRVPAKRGRRACCGFAWHCAGGSDGWAAAALASEPKATSCAAWRQTVLVPCGGAPPQRKLRRREFAGTPPLGNTVVETSLSLRIRCDEAQGIGQGAARSNRLPGARLFRCRRLLSEGAVHRLDALL